MKNSILSKRSATAFLGIVTATCLTALPEDGLIFHFNASDLDSLGDGANVNVWVNRGSLGGTMGVYDAPHSGPNYVPPVLVQNLEQMQGQSAVMFTAAGNNSTILSYGLFQLPDPDAGFTVFAAYTGGDTGVRALGYLGKGTDAIFGGGFGLEGAAAGNGPGFRFGSSWGSMLTGEDNIPFGPGEAGAVTWQIGQNSRVVDASLRVNGAAIVTDHIGTNLDPDATIDFPQLDNQFLLGGRSNGPADRAVLNQEYQGFLGEILVYNRQLSAAEIEEVEAYLIETYVGFPEVRGWEMWPGLGNVYAEHHPWIFHKHIGWLFATMDDWSDGGWFFDPGMDHWWASFPDTYPWVSLPESGWTDISDHNE